MTEISIKILDMECAACVARLDRVISRLHGVFSAQVNFTASSANVVYPYIFNLHLKILFSSLFVHSYLANGHFSSVLFTA